MEELQFSIKIGTKDLYRFLLHYNYKTFGGIFGVLLSGGALCYLAVNYTAMDNGTRILLLVLGLLFTVVQPVQLFQKAAMQAAKNPVFREALSYEIKQDGICISQGGKQEIIPWDGIVKVTETGKQFLIYTSRVNACIWPKDQISEKMPKVRILLKDYLQPAVYKRVD